MLENAPNPVGDNALSQAIQRGLYGPDPGKVTARKQELKNYLESLKQLVDADLLGCIIVTELLDRDGSRVKMQPIGDPRIVLQTATRLVRQGVERNRAQEAAASEPDPSQH